MKIKQKIISIGGRKGNKMETFEIKNLVKDTFEYLVRRLPAKAVHLAFAGEGIAKDVAPGIVKLFGGAAAGWDPSDPNKFGNYILIAPDAIKELGFDNPRLVSFLTSHEVGHLTGPKNAAVIAENGSISALTLPKDILAVIEAEADILGAKRLDYSLAKTINSRQEITDKYIANLAKEYGELPNEARENLYAGLVSHLELIEAMWGEY